MNAMKALLLITTLHFSIALIAQPQGKVIEESVVKGKILNHPVRYTTYLPPDYATSDRSYPVVYLLHGYGDDNTGWLQFGEVNRYADKAIAEGTIPPMVIIMPDGDSTFYLDSYDGKEKYEEFFVKEFMPAVEKTFRIKADRRFRGIAGLSMGGFGTLLYSMKHPDLFSAAASLSGAVFDDSTMAGMADQGYANTFAPLYGPGLKGAQRLTPQYYDNSILRIVQTKTADDLRKVRYWIDCGDDDFLTKGNCLLHVALMEKKVPHEFRVRDGAHTWTYWRTGITDALQFIGQGFHQY